MLTPIDQYNIVFVGVCHPSENIFKAPQNEYNTLNRDGIVVLYAAHGFWNPEMPNMSRVPIFSSIFERLQPLNVLVTFSQWYWVCLPGKGKKVY